MSGPTGGSAPLAFRKGITVYPHEIIPGDLMRDQGQLRTVQYVEPGETTFRASLVYFEPLPGYATHVSVPNCNQVYVRRVCRDR